MKFVKKICILIFLLFLSIIYPPGFALCLDEIGDIVGTNTSINKFEVGKKFFEYIVCEDNDQTSPFFGTKFFIIRVKKDGVAGKVLNVKREGASKDIFFELAEPDDIVIVNGGFFILNEKLKINTPLGLVVGGGVKFSRLTKRKYGGVFYVVDKNKFFIKSLGKYAVKSTHKEAIQSSPVLINNYKNDMNSKAADRFNRTAIGLDSENNVIIAGVFNNVGTGASLYEFAEMLENCSKIGINIKIALALDGGPGACIAIPKTGFYIGHGGRNYIPNAIAIYRNRQRGAYGDKQPVR